MKPTHCHECNQPLTRHDFESRNVQTDELYRFKSKHWKCDAEGMGPYDLPDDYEKMKDGPNDK